MIEKEIPMYFHYKIVEMCWYDGMSSYRWRVNLSLVCRKYFTFISSLLGTLRHQHLSDPNFIVHLDNPNCVFKQPTSLYEALEYLEKMLIIRNNSNNSISNNSSTSNNNNIIFRDRLIDICSNIRRVYLCSYILLKNVDQVIELLIGKAAEQGVLEKIDIEITQPSVTQSLRRHLSTCKSLTSLHIFSTQPLSDLWFPMTQSIKKLSISRNRFTDQFNNQQNNNDNSQQTNNSQQTPTQENNPSPPTLTSSTLSSSTLVLPQHHDDDGCSLLKYTLVLPNNVNNNLTKVSLRSVHIDSPNEMFSILLRGAPKLEKLKLFELVVPCTVAEFNVALGVYAVAARASLRNLYCPFPADQPLMDLLNTQSEITTLGVSPQHMVILSPRILRLILLESTSPEIYISFFNLNQQSNLQELELFDGTPFNSNLSINSNNSTNNNNQNNKSIIEYLTNYISNAKGLRSLYMDQIPIRHVQKIMKAVVPNKTLCTLDIDFSPIRKPRRQNTIVLLNTLFAILCHSQALENITVWYDNLVSIDSVIDEIDHRDFILGYQSSHSFSFTRYIYRPIDYTQIDGTVDININMDTINSIELMDTTQDDSSVLLEDYEEDENSVDSFDYLFEDEDDQDDNQEEPGEDDGDRDNETVGDDSF